MSKIVTRNLGSPTNNCVDQFTTPAELAKGTTCEIELTGNTPLDGYADGYIDGYHVKFVSEGDNPSEKSDGDPACKNLDTSGYHRTTVTDVFRGTDKYGNCPSPYSRGVLAAGGINGVIRNREDQLLRTTGKPVVLLRRQYTGPVCPCYDVNRGQARSKCQMCYGVGFVPGYIPYINDSDPLGRIYIRVDPYTEQVELRDQGWFQEVTVSAWTLSAPIVRQRDIVIVYNASDGSEEFRYELTNVTRNDIFQGNQGAQKFTMKRLDPALNIYKFDPFKIPDLTDISVDLSDVTLVREDRDYELLGTQDDGLYPNVITEAVYGDGAFAGLFTEGFKLSYETNFKRALNYQEVMYAPDFNDDGTVDDGYGPIFKATNGKIIKFSTPQKTEDNIGINPLEVIAAEKKKQFIRGWVSGAKAGYLDGINERRARGLE